MCGTRYPSRRGPATEKGAALIVAHGSPAAPDGPERDVRTLAARVGDVLRGWRVRGATLAAPGALEAAVDGLTDRPLLVFPCFMSDGWFVRQAIPRRLEACRADPWELVPPLGLDPALHRLCLEHARDAAAAAGLPDRETALLLAAHGSAADPRPRQAAEAAARFIRRGGVFREVRVGFIEQPPFLSAAADIAGPAVCLPFFAGRAGHVAVDLPAALETASFRGLLLGAIGQRPEIAAIVAAALQAASARSAAVPQAQETVA